ncbi:hypothetical protein [Winogradskyella sp.]|uniref:hypothetical protein n=1 Tax=Winogradskyella sp. TaxID=1883156 RepID=UPI0026353BFE|nr:hypothetical protein [Winogradskyella sp.]
MELTKEQIQYIDNYLKDKGIKYWDVRIEMVDHLVSDMENYSGLVDFETLFKRSLKNANWDSNLEFIHIQSWKHTNKIYRKMHFQEIWNCIKQPKYLIGFIMLYLVFYWITTRFPEALKLLSFLVLGFPMLIMLIEIVRSLVKKLGKSVNIQYGFFYFSFGIIMMNLPIQFLPKAYLHIWMPIVMTIYLIMMFAGYKVYRFALKKVLKMKVLM